MIYIAHKYNARLIEILNDNILILLVELETNHYKLFNCNLINVDISKIEKRDIDYMIKFNLDVVIEVMNYTPPDEIDVLVWSNGVNVNNMLKKKLLIK
ncbi:MAG: hypothetical protein ACD_33C00005G0010 [uncultured bacterium]|nr:MAG: hypothetical protein ACD_33C00005G0010 [uncultured bacterium]